MGSGRSLSGGFGANRDRIEARRATVRFAKGEARSDGFGAPVRLGFIPDDDLL
jgi:hypothetical protein